MQAELELASNVKQRIFTASTGHGDRKPRVYARPAGYSFLSGNYSNVRGWKNALLVCKKDSIKLDTANIPWTKHVSRFIVVI